MLRIFQSVGCLGGAWWPRPNLFSLNAGQNVLSDDLPQDCFWSTE